MSPAAPQLVITLLWIAGLTSAALWLLKHRDQSLPGLIFILVAAFLARLLPAIILPRGALYEMSVFQQAAEISLNNQSIYLVQVAHPYLPMQIYWLAASQWLAENVGVHFPFWVKSVNVLADMVLTLLVYLAIKKQQGEKGGRFGGWLYAINPVTILVCAYQGQFDATTMLFVVLSIYFHTFYGMKNWGWILSALALGLSILNKTWPILLFPIIVIRLPGWRMRILYTFFTGLPLLVGVLFYELLYPGSLFPMIRRAQYAGSISGWWGYSAIGNVLQEWTGRGTAIYEWMISVGKNVGRLAGFASIYFTRKSSAFHALLVAILVMFAAVPNLGLQGFAWLVPLAIILGYYDDLSWFIVSATTYMIIAYWGLHLIELPTSVYIFFAQDVVFTFIKLASVYVWIIVAFWGVQALRGKYLPPLFKLS